MNEGQVSRTKLKPHPQFRLLWMHPRQEEHQIFQMQVHDAVPYSVSMKCRFSAECERLELLTYNKLRIQLLVGVYADVMVIGLACFLSTMLAGRTFSMWAPSACNAFTFSSATSSGIIMAVKLHSSKNVGVKFNRSYLFHNLFVKH